jgi:hypothetical protein
MAAPSRRKRELNLPKGLCEKLIVAVRDIVQMSLERRCHYRWQRGAEVLGLFPSRAAIIWMP